MSERRELVRPDATVAYRVSGPRRAPVLVLLHGATLDHRSWSAQVNELEGRYRVVVPDLRGHGESALDGPFRFDDAVDDVAALLDEVDTGAGLAVGGLSLGGNIAQEIVYRDPGRVDALIVADSTCNTAARHPLAAALTIATLSAMAMGSRESFLRQAAGATSPHDEVRRYVLAANEDRTPREVLEILASLLRDGLHPDPGYRLPVPTLLLHGADDRIGDIATGTRDWADRDPMTVYAVVPEAGHASNQDNPAAFAAALLAFLDIVLPASPASPAVRRAAPRPSGLRTLARSVVDRLRAALARGGLHGGPAVDRDRRGDP